jgi:hypothetical protein
MRRVSLLLLIVSLATTLIGLLVSLPNRANMLFMPSGSGGGISPDGSFIQAPATGVTGAAAGSLRTVYGTFSFGDLYAPVPHYGGGQLYIPLLNGVQMEPGQTFVWAQFFYVGYGGNAFAMVTGDQLQASWSNSSWNGDNGGTGPGPFTGFPGFGGANQIPVGTPTPPTLPTAWAGPYTPSADGTAISGGTGTLTSARGDGGIWTFGAASGGGYIMQRQGITVSTPNSGSLTPYIVTDMQISAFGSLFFKTVDTVWHVWSGHQANASTGPPGTVPIPVAVNFTPNGSLPHVTVGSADGTFVAGVVTTMSDGGSSVGTLSIGLDFNTGTRLLRNWNSADPCPSSCSANTTIVVCGVGTIGTGLGCVGTYNGSSSPVTVTQNGASIVSKINAQ